MNSLAFEKIARIQSTLRDVNLENLVAVFSRTTTDDLLLVYLSNAELPRGATFQSIILQDLHQNLDAYDGPVLGFTALDLVLENVVTKGARFYPLAKLFYATNRVAELQRTRAMLARYLWAFRQTDHFRASALSSARLDTKIMELALPALLEKWRSENLIAVLPPRNLGEFLNGCATLVYVGEPPASDDKITALALENLPAFSRPSDTWIVAFEEVAMCDTQINPRSPFFMELRYPLRAAGARSTYQETARQLARAFYSTARSDQARDTAFALATEYWLTDGEVDDLIALLPDPDFERFAATGASRRYFRFLSEAVTNAPDAVVQNFSLERFFTDVDMARSAATFAVLRDWLDAATPARCLDLTSILWQAGRAHAVAQTMLLYSRDLSETSSNARSHHEIHLGNVVDLAARACVIYGLSNPWDWAQGRQPQMLAHAYANLTRALDTLIESSDLPETFFYRMLRAWYAGARANPTEIEKLVRDWVDQGNLYLESKGGLAAWRERAERLVRIGEAIIDILATGGQPGVLKRALRAEPNLVGRLVLQNLRAAVDPNLDLEMPSGLFFQQMDDLYQILEPVQLASRRESGVDERIRQLEESLRQLARAQRLIFAQPHEMAILNFVYASVIEDSTNLLQRLKTSASLQCDLLNDSAPIHERSRVGFLLNNIGAVAAPNVEVTLLASEMFNIIDESPVQKLGDLAPNQAQTVTYTIYPRADQDLRLRLTFAGHDRERKYVFDPKEFRLPVMSLDHGVFLSKENPYIYGVPIQTSRFFFGRATELLGVLAPLVGSGHQNFVLRGPRRTGKTSLLFMLEAIMENIPGARQRFQIPAEWNARLDQMRALFLNLQEIEPSGGHIDAELFFAALLPRLGRTLDWNARAIEDMLAYFDSLKGYGLSLQVQSALERYAQTLKPDQRVVILMDEFDLLSATEDKSFFDFLRAIVQKHQWITWILASAVGLYRDVKAYESPFFNLFKPINLQDLDFQGARRLILESSENLHLQFLSEAVNAIYQVTHGHPYFLQLLCSEIIQEVNRIQTNYVTYERVEQVAQQIVQPGQSTEEHFKYLWDTAMPMGQLILAILAQRRESVSLEQLRVQVEHTLQVIPEVSPAWIRPRLADGLNWLDTVLEAIALDQRDQYFFSRPLFARWFLEKNRHVDLMEQALQAVRAQIAGEEHDG